MYKLYIGLVQIIGKDCNAFYFRPSKSKLRFEKAPVGINKLNDIFKYKERLRLYKRWSCSTYILNRVN